MSDLELGMSGICIGMQYCIIAQILMIASLATAGDR